MSRPGEELVVKKPKLRSPRPGPRRPVQTFTCGPYEFNVNKALGLAAKGEKYKPERRWPNPGWVGPFIQIDADYIEQADLSKPIVFVTLITDGQPWHVLIDGNHRVLKALRHGVSIDVIQLNLADTLQVIRGPTRAIEQMRQEGARLGLLG